MTPQNSYWSDNLKFLRLRKKMSQEDLSGNLQISRSKLAAHEVGQVKSPSIEDLINFSEFFKISIDTLIKVDISRLSELKLRELEAGKDVTGGKIRVLAITVDKKNKENITFVPIKAKAGYRAGYSDPSYLGTLPQFNLPHLPEKRTYRMFPTGGNSMLPIPENSLILTQYVEDWTILKDKPCIVILKNEADFVFKNITFLDESKSLVLHSMNAEYIDTVVFSGDVLEIWSYHSHITDVIPSSDHLMDQILKTVNEINVNVKSLKK